MQMRLKQHRINKMKAQIKDLFLGTIFMYMIFGCLYFIASKVY